MKLPSPLPVPGSLGILRCLSMLALLWCCTSFAPSPESWIRINLLGYQPQSPKVAVWGGKGGEVIASFQLVDAATQAVVFEGKAGKDFGAYGPFQHSYRLNFTAYKKTEDFFFAPEKRILLRSTSTRKCTKALPTSVCITCGNSAVDSIPT